MLARAKAYNPSMLETLNEYGARSQEFWRLAQVNLQGSDPVRASENLWGAAAQAVKALAEERGWPHGSHRGLYNVINRLEEEPGQERLGELFAIASALHQNFYEGWMPMDEVQRRAANVQELREALSGVLESPPE